MKEGMLGFYLGMLIGCMTSLFLMFGCMMASSTSEAFSQNWCTQHRGEYRETGAWSGYCIVGREPNDVWTPMSFAHPVVMK